MSAKIHLWEIGMSLTKDGSSSCRANVNLNIGATSIEEAISLAAKRHPTATVWSVVHRGILHIKTDANETTKD